MEMRVSPASSTQSSAARRICARVSGLDELDAATSGF